VIGLDARVRPLESEPSSPDAVRLQRMFARLSPDTVHRRFFTLFPRLPESLLRTLMTVDHWTSEALVVVVGDEIVALASYHRSVADPSVADVALLVEDGWQGRGLGGRLTRALRRLAVARGVRSFHADVLASNQAAVGLIRGSSGGRARGAFVDGELAYVLPLVPAAA
jgi:GNAT superfamily N-acetyltransferase